MKVILKNVTLSFPHLFKKSEKFGKFGANFIFDKESPAAAAMESGIQTVLQEKWGPDAHKVLAKIKATGKGGFVRDGETQAGHAGYEGRLFVRASADVRPDIRNKDATPLGEEDGVLYAGAIVNAILDLSTFKNGYGTHLSLRVLGVQFVKDGTRLAGGPVAEATDFVPLTDEE